MSSERLWPRAEQKIELKQNRKITKLSEPLSCEMSVSRISIVQIGVGIETSLDGLSEL